MLTDNFWQRRSLCLFILLNGLPAVAQQRSVMLQIDTIESSPAGYFIVTPTTRQLVWMDGSRSDIVSFKGRVILQADGSLLIPLDMRAGTLSIETNDGRLPDSVRISRYKVHMSCPPDTTWEVRYRYLKFNGEPQPVSKWKTTRQRSVLGKNPCIEKLPRALSLWINGSYYSIPVILFSNVMSGARGGTKYVKTQRKGKSDAVEVEKRDRTYFDESQRCLTARVKLRVP